MLLIQLDQWNYRNSLTEIMLCRHKFERDYNDTTPKSRRNIDTEPLRRLANVQKQPAVTASYCFGCDLASGKLAQNRSLQNNGPI
ncbi:MAG: hypothetical protein GY820_18465 [Gammaproteobacteria bacterium]|nr:hypothetical protein [Gammaproteobacteria bacterium]